MKKPLNTLRSLLRDLFLLLLFPAAAGWMTASLFFSSIILTLLGGSFLMYALLFVAGVSVLGGAIFLLARPITGERAELNAKRAQLRAERVEAHSGALAQLEEKKAQLEVERARIRDLEVKVATQVAEVKAREAKVAAREAAIEEKEKQVMIEGRRLKAWQRQAAIEKAEWKAELARLKAQYGDVLPDAVRHALADDLDRRLEAPDPPLFWGMFRNPFGLTEAPKPLKQPDNPLHGLLEQGVAQGVITEKEFEEVTCPISFMVMLDPVKSTDLLGRTYDRYCLENRYYALPGTYPFDRSEMTVEPVDLPRDQACYDKIQQLVKRCQPQLSSSQDTEESARSSLEISV